MKKDLSIVTLIGVEDRKKYLPIIKTAADICQKDFSFGSIKILSSVDDIDPRVVKIQPINSTTGFSELCIKEIWKYIETDYALFFQYDGFILNYEAWTDEFLKYDYIGAPWYHLGKPLVGNGGFSLRSKKLLKLISENYKEIGGDLHPEDYWICNTARPFLESQGIKFASIELASKFSKEGDTHGVVWNGEFGFHGLGWTDISKWLNKNQQYKDKFKQKFSDYTLIMRRYPIYDGTVHTFLCKPIQVVNYRKLASNKKNYDCRIDYDLKWLDEIKTNHKIIYKLFRISVEKVGIPAFEKRVSKIEKFSSKKELTEKYPEIKITNSFNLPKWRQRLIKVLGNLVFPKDSHYTVIWFKS